MKAYLISIFITVILISLTRLVLPKGKISAAATGVLSFAMIFCFLKPIGSLSFGEFFPEKTEEESLEMENLEAFNRYVDRNLEAYYASAFKETLKKDDLICEKVNVEICDKKIVKTEIYLSNPVIDEKYEHININVITDYVAKLLGLEREVLTVYG